MATIPCIDLMWEDSSDGHVLRRSPVLDQPVFRYGVAAVPIVIGVMFVAYLAGVPFVIPVLAVGIMGWVCVVAVLLVRDARRRS